MKQYLDSRFLQTDQIKSIRRGSINYKNGNEDYAVESCELWPDKLDVEYKLFSKEKIDTEIKLEFLDIPMIHSYTGKMGNQFFNSLAGVDSVELFESKCI